MAITPRRRLWANSFSSELAEPVSVASGLEQELARLHEQDLEASQRIYAYTLRRQSEWLGDLLGLPRLEGRNTKREG